MSPDVLPATDRIEHYVGKLTAYIRSMFPKRFYSGEKWWTLYLAAALLRLADMAEAVLAHLPDRRDQDAAAALRGMYELVVTVTWLLIDPEMRKQAWEDEALSQQLKLHNDLTAFGEQLLTPNEISAAQGVKGLPPLTIRAEESDEHWSQRVRGLHAPGHLLSFRGLYNGIYRLGSQPTHGSIASLLPCIEQERNRFAVREPQPGEGTLPYALVSPLLAMTLIIASTQINWVDEALVRELNNYACEPGNLA